VTEEMIENDSSPSSNEEGTAAQEVTSSPEATPTASEGQPHEAAPAPKTWDELGLSETALELVKKAGFTTPSPVQQAALPIALKGHDLIASAQTGSGKTAAFVIPMTEKLAGREGTYGLILAPTRELAQQIQATMDIFGTPRGVRSAVLIGGIDMRLDKQALETYPQVIIATPGRLVDHLERGNVWLNYLEFVVLDEADRMLDMGFADQLNRIMGETSENKQTLLFSATIPPMVEKLASKILKNPERVTIGRPLGAANSVEQRMIKLREDDKMRELRRVLEEVPGTTIVFTRSKDKAVRVFRQLHSSGFYDIAQIHSDLQQQHREQALADFKSGKVRILIATDVAGRGIHVDAVAHVVNYDLPMEAEDYIHRIGRTGRASSTGIATSFVVPQDRMVLKRIRQLVGKPIPGLDDEGPAPADSEPSREGRGRDRGRRGGRDRDRNRDRAPRNEQPQQEGAPAPAAVERPVVAPKPQPIRQDKAAQRLIHPNRLTGLPPGQTVPPVRATDVLTLDAVDLEEGDSTESRSSEERSDRGGRDRHRRGRGRDRNESRRGNTFFPV
jgi:ATP-dependent RNA helicase RhlE